MCDLCHLVYAVMYGQIHSAVWEDCMCDLHHLVYGTIHWQMHSIVWEGCVHDLHHLVYAFMYWQMHSILCEDCMCDLHHLVYAILNAFCSVRGLCVWLASSCVCSHVLTNAFCSVRGLCVWLASSCVCNHTLTNASHIDHEPAYTPPPPPWGFYHMVISGYLDHQRTQFRLSASELLLFVSMVLVLINALYGIPNCDDLVS